MTKPQYSVSITDLAHFCCRSGDLNPVSEQRTPTAQEGLAGQKMLQSRRPAHYQAEVSVQAKFETACTTWTLKGRADGVIAAPKYLVEEIKTTYFSQARLPATQQQLHLAQTRLYAALLLQQNALTSIEVVLTYLYLEDETEYSFQTTEVAESLNQFLHLCVEQFGNWLDAYSQYLDTRNQSLELLTFPYQDYRPGQRQLSVTLYRDIRDKRNGLYHAPTGLGKTTAMLFPALKQLRAQAIKQVWYLTAKNSGQKSVKQTMNALQTQQPSLRVLFLQAKVSQCPCLVGPETEPEFKLGNTPQQCRFQTGYYDRLEQARNQFRERSNFSDADLLRLSQEFDLCPHQLSRDLLPWVDLVVADYNYVFDPQARLQEYLTKQSKYISLLVDEAHNLPDRARDMFSASLSSTQLMRIEQSVSSSAMKKAIKQLQKQLKKVINQTEDGHQLGTTFRNLLKSTTDRLLEWFAESNASTAAPELFEPLMQLWQFATRAQTFDDKDALIRTPEPGSVRIFCTDPAPRLNRIADGFHSVHYFSGSLLPQAYFSRSFSQTPFASQLILESPFPPQHQRTLIRPVNTRYPQRQQSAPLIAQTIATLWSAHPGRYLLAFPSFEYLDLVARHLDSSLPILIQPGVGKLKQRREFLRALEQTEYLAMVIAGGIFAEGIDLQHNKLSGVLIVGTCLPPPSAEQDLIKQRFDQEGLPGFDFAYRYPGLNKVIQTAGRLIRSDEDQGVVVLIDDRYTQNQYRRLLPIQWRPSVVATEQKLRALVEDFFLPIDV